jgi:signal transduction histidine kinase
MDLDFLKKRYFSDNKQVEEKIEDMMERIDKMMARTHSLCALLRPELLEDLGIRAAMEHEIANVSSCKDLKIELTWGLAKEKLDYQISLNLFRICQETLTNILRHSQADQVEIALEESEGEIKMTVEDNGKGISGEEIHSANSLGLIGMRERAYSLGGRLDIERSEEGGTRLTVVLPSYEELKND